MIIYIPPYNTHPLPTLTDLVLILRSHGLAAQTHGSTSTHCNITLHEYSREEPVPSLAGRSAIRTYIHCVGRRARRGKVRAPNCACCQIN